jgi:hypothetical protein
MFAFADVRGAIVASRLLCSDAMLLEYEVLEHPEALDAAH